jgi:hypothetical protein
MSTSYAYDFLTNDMNDIFEFLKKFMNVLGPKLTPGATHTSFH